MEQMQNIPMKSNTWQVMGELFELNSRYRVVDYLGAGAYGVVCAVHDSKCDRIFAIKKCKKIFHSRTLAKRTLRELRLLRLFHNENIVKIECILEPLDWRSFDSLYVVFELMETDLAQIIRSPQHLKDQHVQYFTYQILVALRYLHASDVVHRDLKPRNLLVNGDCTLKVADFGLSRLYNEYNETKIMAMTEYVTTRWYRAPEVLVGWSKYSSKIDMWALGCIMAELIGRAPLFPGNDSMRQIDLICQCLGKPNEAFVQQCRKSAFRHYLRDFTDIEPAKFGLMFPDANPLALDLMESMLKFNPEDRISAADALQHPYITSMPTCFQPGPLPNKIPAAEFEFENRRLTLEELRQELIKEVRVYHPIDDVVADLLPSCIPAVLMTLDPMAPAFKRQGDDLKGESERLRKIDLDVRDTDPISEIADPSLLMMAMPAAVGTPTRKVESINLDEKQFCACTQPQDLAALSKANRDLHAEPRRVEAILKESRGQDKKSAMTNQKPLYYNINNKDNDVNFAEDSKHGNSSNNFSDELYIPGGAARPHTTGTGSNASMMRGMEESPPPRDLKSSGFKGPETKLSSKARRGAGGDIKKTDLNQELLNPSKYSGAHVSRSRGSPELDVNETNGFPKDKDLVKERNSVSRRKPHLINCLSDSTKDGEDSEGKSPKACIIL